MLRLCTDNVRTIINWSMAGFYTISICAFVMASTVHFMNRKAYHPVFSFLFMLITSVYCLSNMTAVILFAFTALDPAQNNAAFRIVHNIHEILYIYLTCTVAMCVVERCFATVLMHTYEHKRPWIVLAAAQIIPVVIIALYATVVRGDFLDEIVQFVMSLIIIGFLIFLLYKNIRLTQTLRCGKSSLSTRYQLTENIKALRLLVPVVAFDTIVCVVDNAGIMVFGVESPFKSSYCLQSESYFVSYITIRLISLLMEWCIPFSIIYQQNTPEAFSSCSACLQQHNENNAGRITNVLGKEIQISSNEQLHYFSQLEEQWSRPPAAKP